MCTSVHLTLVHSMLPNNARNNDYYLVERNKVVKWLAKAAENLLNSLQKWGNETIQRSVPIVEEIQRYTGIVLLNFVLTPQSVTVWCPQNNILKVLRNWRWANLIRNCSGLDAGLRVHYELLAIILGLISISSCLSLVASLRDFINVYMFLLMTKQVKHLNRCMCINLHWSCLISD